MPPRPHFLRASNALSPQVLTALALAAIAVLCFLAIVIDHMP